jgi:hypothetical protein
MFGSVPWVCALHLPWVCALHLRGFVPSTGRGWGGRSRRASGTVLARVAAIASRRWRRALHRQWLGRAVAASRIAREARCVLVSLQSCRADGGTRMCRPEQVLHLPWLGSAVASHERHGACSCRCNHVEPMVAHACAARRGSSTGRGWGVQSRCVSGTVRACVAEITSL